MSNLGSLTHCMVDSDAGAIGRARWLRRKALVISVFLEVAVLTAMVLWPLITPAVLPPQLVLTPLPPYHGEPHPDAAPPRSTPHPATHRDSLRPFVFQPAAILAHVSQVPDAAPPDIDQSSTWPEQSGTGPGIPFGNDGGARPRIEPPETHARPNRPVVMSTGVMAASLINQVRPDYPPIAEQMRLSGTVELRAIIGTDGAIRQIEVVSGNPILARAAVEAVRQWRYRPTRLSGQLVEVETLISVNFVLD
ncbi:MAG: TonB family protein [Candidatus Acidiferrales bacterium]